MKNKQNLQNQTIPYRFHKQVCLNSHIQMKELQMKFDYQWRKVEFNDKDIEGRIDSSIVSVNNKVYLFGGRQDENQRHFNDIFAYESSVGVWHNLEVSGDIPSPRCKSALKYQNEKIYLFGGYAGKDKLNDIYIFDPKNLQWMHERPKEYSPSPDLRQSMLSIQFRYPYLIILYNGINNIASPIIWVYDFGEKEWDRIELKNWNSNLTSKNNSCMVGDCIYVIGRSSVNQAPCITEFNLSKLLKQENYDDVQPLTYTFSNWADGNATFGQWFCIQYDQKIKVIYNIKNTLHTNRLMTINMQRKIYFVQKIYGNMNNFQTCSTAISGCCIVAVGKLYDNQQKIAYINITKDQLPLRKYSLLKKQDTQMINEDVVLLVINGLQFRVNKYVISKYKYFQYLLLYRQSSQNRFEIKIMNVKEQNLKEFMKFIEGTQLQKINLQGKSQSLTRIMNLAYLADYFCIERLKDWVADNIYQFCGKCNSLEVMYLANILNLQNFQQYCSKKFIKCLQDPPHIRNALKLNFSKALTKKIKLNQFDLEHKNLNNSMRILGANQVIPSQEQPMQDQTIFSFLSQFKKMMQESMGSS